ncbi:MAG: deoxyribodipyrimidine photolyase [Flavobacteriaceae bacterium]|nr:deoxyribodipyrimidine photolyase [Flavobacteriaceae bacterium]
MKTISIFWFRRDLRLDDNKGLYNALKNHDNVLPIFIYDKNILDRLKKNDHRIQFIKNKIEKINESLSKINKSIVQFYGKPVEVFEKLIQEFQISSIYLNRDYTPYAIKRDNEIIKLSKKNNIKFNDFKDHVLYEKFDITKDDGKPYKVYTPYSRKWLSKLDSDGIKNYPSEKLINNLIKINSNFDFNSLGFCESKITLTKLNFSKKVINEYEETRNFPYKDGTSKIGVHLRFGTLSIRKLVKEARISSNITFLKELVWREFFQQILFHFPHTVNKSFKPQYDRIEWLNSEYDFTKWCNGNTGYALVDAGMRELNKTGFMHNRVRMLVGSFLCKHLLIDWRWGEAYFREKLFDYEPASNIGNWQWVAGCGVDAAPYFRIFNPHEQIKKFDKNFIYIKRWVPEFETENYVGTIVDHKFARERCLEVYKKALK